MEFIGFASDHAGFKYKNLILNYIKTKGFDTIDFGCYSEESANYADFAHKVGYAIDRNEIRRAFVFCGSGNGINMTVNKHQKVRSALCWSNEVAILARSHNDANVCSVPARFVSENELFRIVDSFLDTEFEGGRHCIRVDSIPL